MSYNINDLFVARNSRSGYQIEQSLRFAGETNQYLYRTGAITAQGGVSVWAKFHRDFGSLTSAVADVLIYLGGGGPWLYRNGYGYLYYRSISTGGDTTWSAQRHRDHSAWYHIFLKFNSSNSTSLYVNNVLYGTKSANIGTSSGDQRIGYDGTYYAQFNLAEYHAAFGESLDATDFGEYDDNGVWVPKAFTGNYGSEGFYLKFDPSAANGLGHDHSGNGNHFTNAGGFATSGTGTDVMSDTPTTNWCTLNPVGTTYGFIAPTDGNLKTDSNSYSNSTEGTFGIPKDGNLYYFEGTMTRDVGDGGTGLFFGVHTQGHTTSPASSGGKGFIVYGTDGSGYDGALFAYQYDGNNLSPAIYGHIDSGTNLAFAIKYDSGTWSWYYRQGSNGWYYHNGSSWEYNSTFDETEPTATYSSVPESETLVPIGNNVIFNFGQRDFAFTPPTGAKLLRSSDLPAPSIKDGGKHFSANLWTGNGTTNHALTGFGFQPDFVWGKARSQAYAHTLFDSIRGGAYRLYINNSTPPGQDYLAEYIKSFDSDGITVGSDSNMNGTNVTYVGWSWKAGGTVSANNNEDGDIITTVSANPDAGFSIIKYTSSNTAGDGIGHGLGKPPVFFIIKNIDASDHYAVYHQSMGNSSALLMNSPNNAYTGTVWWNNTTPNNTVITLGTETSVNNSSSDDYICWAWAEIEGYSKFGIIKGNYTSNGPFIYLGFTPAFLMFKNAERTSTDWALIDTSRDPYNYAGRALRPNQANSEDSYTERLDILSNGFKLRTSDLNYNGPDDAPGIIYAAFAKHPFGGDGVSPATAR